MSKNHNIPVRILDLPGAGGGCACSDLSRTPEYAAAVQQKVAELKTALESSLPGPGHRRICGLAREPGGKSWRTRPIARHAEISHAAGGHRRPAEIRRVHSRAQNCQGGGRALERPNQRRFYERISRNHLRQVHLPREDGLLLHPRRFLGAHGRQRRPPWASPITGRRPTATLPFLKRLRPARPPNKARRSASSKPSRPRRTSFRP